MRNGANFFAHFLDQSFTIYEGGSGRGETFDIIANVRQVHTQPNQQLTDTVVQFAGEMSPFIILQLE